jgi:hypothetical protein
MYCRSRPQYRSDLGWISGVAFLGTLTRSARPVQGFTFVRCCSMPPASSPHGLAAPGLGRLTTAIPACSCLQLAVATNSLRRGLSPPIQCPCLAHQAPKPRSGAPWARGSTARARTELSSGSRDARLFMVGSERRLAMARQFSGGSSDDGSCRERFERRLLWASR